jgi:DNA replication protein DnaC
MSRAHAAGDLIRAQARPLKMPGLARTFDALARQAREERWTHEEYLYEVLAAELTSRADSAVRQRLHTARFPEHKPLDSFDFAAAPEIDAGRVLELARGDWIERAENVLLAGPIGTGKTHLAIALGIEAARQRRHVGFWRAADLVRSLLEARDARELTRLHRRLARLQLLIVDELGFVPFDRPGGELLFNLLAARYEKSSVIVTTNLAFSEWPQVFAGDEKLATALIDRLADRGTIITTKGKSFRLQRRRGREPSAATAASGPPSGDVAES